MEKVKIFTEGNSDTFVVLESEINAWLENNGGKIEIISRHATTACGINVEHRGFVNHTITIFYTLMA